MQTLLLTQFGCFIIKAVLALLLVISRIHIRNKNKIYEGKKPDQVVFGKLLDIWHRRHDQQVYTNDHVAHIDPTVPEQ